MEEKGQVIIFKDLLETQFNGDYDDMLSWLNEHNCNKKVVFIAKNGHQIRRYNGDPYVIEKYYNLNQIHQHGRLVGVLLADAGQGEAMGLDYVDGDFVYVYDVKNNYIDNDTGIKWYVNGRFINEDEF